MTTTHWELQWLVPARRAIGGKSYWTSCENGRFESEERARAAFDAACNLGDGHYRLCKVTRETIAKSGGVTP